jgi:hypothetical protein
MTGRRSPITRITPDDPGRARNGSLRFRQHIGPWRLMQAFLPLLTHDAYGQRVTRR